MRRCAATLGCDVQRLRRRAEIARTIARRYTEAPVSRYATQANSWRRLVPQMPCGRHGQKSVRKSGACCGTLQSRRSIVTTYECVRNEQRDCGRFRRANAVRSRRVEFWPVATVAAGQNSVRFDTQQMSPGLHLPWVASILPFKSGHLWSLGIVCVLAAKKQPAVGRPADVCVVVQRMPLLG